MPPTVRRHPLLKTAGPVAATLVLGCALSLLLFAGARRWEWNRLQSDFYHQVDNRVSALKLVLKERLADGEFLAAVLSGREEVDLPEFQRLAGQLIQSETSLQALEWIPRVPGPQRPQFEQAARSWPLADPVARRVYSQFQITERTPEGRTVPAASRAEYYPVYYVEPCRGNEAAVGFDLASETSRRLALAQALATGRPAATSRVRLVQETGNQFGLLVFVPVYQRAPSTEAAASADAGGRLRGLLLEVFRVGDLADQAFGSFQPVGLDKLVLDLSAPEPERALYVQWSRLDRRAAQAPRPLSAWRAGLYREATFSVADRQWSMIVQASPAFIAARRTWAPEGLLLGGLLLTGTLAGYLALGARRAGQLARANQQLLREIAERQGAEEQLRSSQARLQLQFDLMPIACITWDRQNRVASWNPAAQKTFGYTAAEALGKRAFDLMVPPQLVPLVQQVEQRLRQGEIDAHTVNENCTKDGRSIFCAWTSTPLRDAEDRFIGVLSMAQDVTARQRAEQELKRTHEELVQSSRLAGMAEVATSVLHNAGNVLNSVNVASTLLVRRLRDLPLNHVALAGQLLQQHAAELPRFLTEDDKGRRLPDLLVKLGAHLSQQQRELLEELQGLHQNIGHIKEIIAMQQTYAKRGGVLEHVVIPELLDSVLKLQSAACQRQDIELVRDYEPVPPVLVDKHKLLQILINLFENARQACVAGGQRPRRIRARVRCAGPERLRIEVVDNGVGIAAEHLPRLFQFGFTTRKDGHGFGLHSGALAAKELGTTLAVHSAGPGHGATFSLELPLHPPPADAP